MESVRTGDTSFNELKSSGKTETSVNSVAMQSVRSDDSAFMDGPRHKNYQVIDDTESILNGVMGIIKEQDEDEMIDSILGSP